MSQYPGGQAPPPPDDPYYGQQPGDPYAPQQPWQDPYFGAAPPSDPYAPPLDPYYSQQGQPGQYQQPGWGAPPPPPPPPPAARQGRGGSGAAIFGVILVLVGVWVLFGDQLDMDLEWSEIWPIGAVIIGAIMVLASLIPGRSERNG